MNARALMASAALLVPLLSGAVMGAALAPAADGLQALAAPAHGTAGTGHAHAARAGTAHADHAHHAARAADAADGAHGAASAQGTPAAPLAAGSTGLWATEPHDHTHSLRVEAAPQPRPLPPVPRPGAPGEYLAPPPLTFRCPALSSDMLAPANAQPTDRTDMSGCPFRVYDATYQFGNAQLALKPGDPSQVVFTSLHSAPDERGPTPRSRTPGQTHTAFTSYDQGMSWSDEPIGGFEGGGPGLAQYGEASSVVMDAEGNIYLAYLWSTAPVAEDAYGASIALYKAGTSRERGTVLDSYSDPQVLESRTSTNPIERVHLVHVPPYEPPPDLNATGNLTGGPASEAEIGQSALQTANATDTRVAAVWFERATAPPYGPNGYPGWIDAAITHTGSNNSWSRLPDPKVIGPCLDGSNPVAWQGLVYVACVVDKGYDHRSRARIGDTDIWAIDPLTGNTTLVGQTDVVGGHPMLAATSDGYFALVSTRFDSNVTGAVIQASYGWYGTTWDRPRHYGQPLYAMAGAKPVYDAGITAIALSEAYKFAALVYMEWQQPVDATEPQPPQPPPLPDPTNPGVRMPILKDYRKFLVVAMECGEFPVAGAELQMGTGIDPTNFDAYTQRPSLFDDLQDGLVPYQERSGEDVWYFAVNDYGAMQYGAVVTAAVPTECSVGPAPPAVPTPAVPQALALSQGTNLIVGSTVGVAALAMVLYLLTVKRRVASTVAAEDK